MARVNPLFWKISAVLLLLVGCRPSTPPPATPNSMPPSASNIRFRNVTKEAQIAFNRNNGAYGKYYLPETMGGGGAFIDYDNDGYPDILLLNGAWWEPRATNNGKPTPALYHNNRNGTFTDVTKEMGLDIFCAGMGVAVGDYDNDGYDDLYITAVGRNYLFHNEKGKGFKEVAESTGVMDKGWSSSAGWVDYDNDGKLDLFVCHYVQWTPETDISCTSKGFKSYCRPQEYLGESCRLYHNEGNGRFRDVTHESGIENQKSKALGVAFFDLNGDGYTDIVVTNDMEPNFVFLNSGKGAFKEVGFESGIALGDSANARAGMGVDIADYRNEGNFGLAIGNFSFEGLGFYPITPKAPYLDTSKQIGTYTPSFPYVTFGLFFADFDNDSWQDLFFTNGHIEDTVHKSSPEQNYEQPSVLLRNRGDGTFADVSAQAGADLTAPIVGRGACAGDFDNDGKIDILLIPNKGEARLLHNETSQGGHWVKFRLVGRESNRNGYGARITVEAGGKRFSTVCHSGSSYQSASDARVHIGLGDATQITRVVVRWTTGKEQVWTGITPDKIWQLTEGEALAH